MAGQRLHRWPSPHLGWWHRGEKNVKSANNDSEAAQCCQGLCTWIWRLKVNCLAFLKADTARVTEFEQTSKQLNVNKRLMVLMCTDLGLVNRDLKMLLMYPPLCVLFFLGNGVVPMAGKHYRYRRGMERWWAENLGHTISILCYFCPNKFTGAWELQCCGYFCFAVYKCWINYYYLPSFADLFSTMGWKEEMSGYRSWPTSSQSHILGVGFSLSQPHLPVHRLENKKKPTRLFYITTTFLLIK